MEEVENGMKILVGVFSRVYRDYIDYIVNHLGFLVRVSGGIFLQFTWKRRV